jgi:hypothetical protein
MKFDTATMSEKKYWEIVRHYYQNTELGLLDTVTQKQLVLLFCNDKFPNRDMIMTDNEKEMLKSFPKTITIYRGVSSRKKLDFKKYGFGVSWTLNKDTAKWFASRFQNRHKVVLQMEIPTSDVLAYFKREDEIVIDTTNCHSTNIKSV